MAEKLYIKAFSDADHATDPADRKSITGSVIKMNGAVVVFGTVKQKGVSKSTLSSEYIGMSDTTKLVLWRKIIIARIQGKKESDSECTSANPAWR